ncbi:TetR/AcrR family transcriptional regulator [Zavarzinia compransoris]|uniref:TetR/AcrR family transcriptional regulator n=1 Tax=Zavarzinia marina TaxID=2911065 RepID=UPI001F17B205|nr:TetR/AcrR family transcriptional regulator [Zavarzinia marina]MCF4165192.1 TetR/AcrR family transcriptional regulator [Zavarzinia marina]
MAAPRHRDEIVRAASRLFRKRGYAATGLNDILAESGAPKGSLYHYFPDGKEQLAEEALRLSGDVVTATLRHLRERHGNGIAMVEAYGRMLAGWMADSGFRDGCPIATTILETVPESPRLTEAARAVFEDWNRAFEDVFVADGETPARARRLAGLVVAVMEGALIQCRVSGSPDPILDATAEIVALLRAA